ncbi:hypothetical protein [Streptomyces resistomycificus]|uniref:hypothetical protein n=1 Tax=Streptomyces resistomycificus TaxID=67356 RepID=UPI0012FEF135|nr:hypothetical protein [Streptomyces resistomycificus]
MTVVASAQFLLAEDVGSWSIAHWVGVIVSVLVGTVLLIALTIAALSGARTAVPSCWP